MGMCVCLYKSNKWWKMKLLAISMAIQNKQGGVFDAWGQKHKDVERDSLPRQRPSTTSFPLGMGQRVRGWGSLPDSPPWAVCPSLCPCPSQAQPWARQIPREPRCPGSHGKLRVARQVKFTECSHTYLENKNQGLLSRVIPSGKKARIGAESNKIKEAT